MTGGRFLIHLDNMLPPGCSSRQMSCNNVAMMVDELDRVLIGKAAEALARDLLVAFPTETVYGLGASAESLPALARLYRVKGRPDNHPVIVHLHALEQLELYAQSVPAPALELARRYWPGPLTLILPKSRIVPDQVTGGQSSVGLRIPNHPLALALLKEFGKGVAAPSANRFGRLSPTSAADVANEFGDDVAAVLDGGACEVGIESTIVDFSGSLPRLLRPGMLLPEAIEAVVGRLEMAPQVLGKSPETRAPGGLASHYAPRTPLSLLEWSALAAALAAEPACAVLSFRKPQSAAGWIQAPAEARAYAQSLYANLRQLDQVQAARILVEMPPADAGWIGVRDRLSRAAVRQDANEVSNER